MEKIYALAQRLGIQFNNYSLLSRALTHRSYLNENPNMTLEDNERLEFLGDAVLDFVVGAYLYHHFPELDEGGLTSLRAALVRTETLAGFSRHYDVGSALRLGQGESDNGGRQRLPLLCAAFEAIIGAIYLDQGLDRVISLMAVLAGDALVRIQAESLDKDAKSEFQVWAQAKYNITPRYAVINTSGPDHARMFRMRVLVGDKTWGEGDGRSKQSAAQSAAQAALQKAENHF